MDGQYKKINKSFVIDCRACGLKVRKTNAVHISANKSKTNIIIRIETYEKKI